MCFSTICHRVNKRLEKANEILEALETLHTSKRVLVDDFRRVLCVHCSSEGGLVDYPCQTIQIVARTSKNG